IGMLEGLRKSGVKKPLLSTYAPPFDPRRDPKGRGRVPTRLAFNQFALDGSVTIRPAFLDGWKSLRAPVPTSFLSAHFTFTLGRFCVEVPHDPNLYFIGAETNLEVRAFTHGYDLFNPHRIVLWHEYTRRGRRKHWDEHPNWTRW